MKKINYILGLIIGILLISCSSGGDTSESSGTIPTVTTTVATNINGLNVTLGGNVSSDGNSAIIQYGVCWQKTPNPTINSGNVTESAAILGDFSINTEVIEPNTLYYAKAFAINQNGVAYGNQITFTSGNSIISKMPTDILTKSVVLRVKIVPSPNMQISQMGYCIDTSPNPTSANYIYNGGGTVSDGVTSYTATGFQPNTTYYARPFYTESTSGISYFGDQITFKTCGYYGASGGYVFYDKGEVIDGWRYMELAPVTLDYDSSATGADWGCNSTLLSFTYPTFGKGLENTQHILSNCSAANCAARLCDNYTINGLSDWFLPSQEELFTIYKSLKYEGLINSSYNYIWSSTEYDATSAYQVWFISSDHADAVTEPKSYNSVVTPVRRF
jgi:hypothetical protein